MKIVFRADSSLQIGTGHVIRCRTLARTLRERGAEVTFVCRAHEGNVAHLLERDGFPMRMLPVAGKAPASPDPYASWVGATEEQDARETSAAIDGSSDLLVVDHYGLSAAWEKAMRGAFGKILALDDLGRSHATDVLMDQNFSRTPEARYEGRAGDAALLLGPRFALLQPEYAALAAARTPRATAVRRILIFFGGVDRENLTGRALAALTAQTFDEIDLDLVIGTANPHAEIIGGMARARARTQVHAGLPSLAHLMARADLAIGAGGGTMWERCAAGLPTVAISMADNQIPSSADMGAAGIIDYLGRHEDVSAGTITHAVRALIDNPARRQIMAERSRLLVDGLGAMRVAETVYASPPDALRLRPATASDREFFFQLANDPDVRRQSFSSAAITWDEHKRWYEAKTQEARTRLYVLEAQGLPIGQIRFDDHHGSARLSYALDPIARGRGWGTRLVEMGLSRLGMDAPRDVIAEVRRENAGSRAVFEKLGFAQEALADRTRHILSREKLVSRLPAHPSAAS